MKCQKYARLVGCSIGSEYETSDPLDSGMNPRIIAGIPAVNEEKTIAQVVIGASKFVDKVIVVDDGSNDMTGEIARRLGAEVIRHKANLGKGSALRSIFRRACELNADVLVTLDADGQHSPSDIPRVLSPIMDDGVDISIGSRFIGKSPSEMPGYRQFGTQVIRNVVKSISGAPIKDTESGFRAYGGRAISTLLPCEMGMGADSVLLVRANEKGLSIAEVPVNISYKGLKSSKHNPVYHAFDILASLFKFFSIRHPLMFYGIPGIVFLVIGIAFAVWTFDVLSTHLYFSTNLALIAVSASIVGIVLIAIGVMLFTIITVLRERS